MATILITWELGEGLGHLVGLAPLMEELALRGHRVFAALRNLSKARVFFPDNRIFLLPAPSRIRPSGSEILRPMTFAHILHNVGFDNLAELDAMYAAWQNMIELISPNVILFEHSPTALLATLGMPCRRVIVGTGFVIPPDVTQMPNLRPWFAADDEELFRDEQRVLHDINQILASRGQKRLDYLSQLFAQVDDSMFITFRELDHYQQRNGAKYWGTTTSVQGQPPDWAPGRRRRIFAYLSPFAGMDAMLTSLACEDRDLLVYSPGVSPDVRRRCESERLRFAHQPLDMQRVTAECDAAILNGSHGATTAMLLAGKPILQLPLHLEQTIVTLLVERIGAGCGASRRNQHGIQSALEKLLRNDSYRESAAAFAAKYAGFDAMEQVHQMADLIESHVF